ncbi:aromatic acid exporter family protein [Vagococcus acidifermentans]|uniref:Putative aromatic acid exporter C-terminal domain-containing protein n=1 Tax=Vagococcus acidifermentans TaxID=564710 RepID=A0A430AWU6_9ENTE|nr:aromatic acid exporter family protein [Vagococcus acidifermentans]RSU12528.1 hypothetical protein CBF27_06015 [Vagococcus acidifermentans]
MKIGLRTIKTAISAALAIWLAAQLGLLYPATAGVIAILSVTNTKKSSFKVGLSRLIALATAIIIAFVCYRLIGYNALAFGVYLLLFIPCAARWGLSEGIPVSSVLVTHFLNEQSISFELIVNSFSLLVIGAGLALLSNLYMPSTAEKIKRDKQAVDETIRYLLKKMSQTLADKSLQLNCEQILDSLDEMIQEGREYARRDAENRLLGQSAYEMDYFDMRNIQVTVLKEMLDLLEQTDVSYEIAEGIRELFEFTYDTYGEDNDGLLILEKIERVYESYRTMPLPATREEFENRARLYQLLTEFKTFIDIKVVFSQTKLDAERQSI